MDSRYEYIHYKIMQNVSMRKPILTELPDILLKYTLTENLTSAVLPTEEFGDLITAEFNPLFNAQ